MIVGNFHVVRGIFDPLKANSPHGRLLRSLVGQIVGKPGLGQPIPR
jgi:hypothetical protein